MRLVAPALLALGWIGAGAASAGELTAPSCGRPKAPASSRAGGAMSVSDKPGLSPEVIQRVVRDNFGRFRLCYEAALRSCPNLQGRVAVKATIRPNGTVTNVRDGGSDVADSAVTRCVLKEFGKLEFPAFQGKPIQLSYPILFGPGG